MQESFLKKCEKNFLFSAKLKQLFKKKKNTLVLFSYENFTGENVEKVGKWLLGATLGMKKKQCQLIDDNGVHSLQINLTQNHSIHIHENDKNRIVTIDLLKFEDNKDQDENKLSNLLIALTLISKISLGSLIKAYALINATNYDCESIKKELKLKFSPLNFIEWVWNPEQADQDQDGNLSIVKNKEENSKGPENIEKLFVKKNDVANIFGNYISLKVEQASPQKGGKAKQKSQTNLIKSFQNTRGNLTTYLFSLIKPLTKIFEQVYLGNDYINNQLNELFMNQINEIKNFVDGQKQLRNLKNLIEMPNTKKMDEYFAWKYYTMSYIMLRQESEEKEKKKLDPPIQLFKDFVHKLYQNLIYTPLTIPEEDIRYLNVVINLIAEHFQFLESISEKYCGFQVQEVYFVLNLKYKNQEIKLMDIQEKIAQNSVKAQLKSNKNSEYYITTSELLENSFSNKLNIDKLANKDEIKKNFKDMQQKLPMLRTIAVIQNPYQKTEELIKAIKYFFEMHFNISNQLKFQSDSLFKIFKGIGRSLRDFGLPQLAIEVYKKLKFQNLIERCVNEIIIKFKLNQQKQGSQLLLKTGRYFYINGNTGKAARFTQLAYQNCPDISYMKQMLKFKNYNMNNSRQGDELELVAKLSETNDFNQYFNYEFDESFKQSILSLEQLVQNSQVNLNIVVTQQQLSKFSFFSQALTEDD